MDFSLVVRRRLEELGTEQRDLAVAAQVTESYISQLLTGKKAPPAPARTGIYDRMEAFLKLPSGKLAKLADLQRKETLKKALAGLPAPLLPEVRELVLRKCTAAKQKAVRVIFEREPFGALERLVTQKLLDVVKKVAREELEDESWLRRVARSSGLSYARLRVIALEFLQADVLGVSADHCARFLDPLIESWDIDLTTFGMEIVLNRRLTHGHSKRFEFVEREVAPAVDEEPGLRAFLQDAALSGDAAPDELMFLKRLTFTAKQPTALYYYRELQNLRDPLHFSPRIH